MPTITKSVPDFLGAVLFTIALFSNAKGDQQADEMIEIFQAGIEQWRQDIAFTGQYRYRQRIAESKQDALSPFAETIGQDEFVATGVLVKRGRNIRFSADYSSSPTQPSQGNGSGNVTTLGSLDAVSYDALHLEYHPLQGKVGDYASITKRPEGTGRIEAQRDHGLLTPFAFNGGRDGAPLKRFFGRPGYKEVTETAVERLDAEHLAIHITRRAEGSHSILTRIVFWTSPSPAVIESISTTGRDANGVVQSEGVTLASHFVECPGGMIARSLRQATGPVVMANTRQKKWLAREWISEDLGDGPPEDEDFVVTIPESTRVNGLKQPPPPGTVRHLDLSQYTVDDLYEGKIDFGPVQTEAGEPNRWRTVVIVVALILIAASGIILWRRLRAI